MGCFFGICAITRVPIPYGTETVCMRVHTKRLGPYVSLWDPHPIAVGPEVNGATLIENIWRGPYDDYGSVEGAPEIERDEDEDRHNVRDVLILANVWDRIVDLQRDLINRNGLVQRFQESFEEALQFQKRAEKLVPGVKFEEYRQGCWPVWVHDLGYVLDFCHNTDVNLLTFPRGAQDYHMDERFQLAEMTEKALAKLHRRLNDD